MDTPEAPQQYERLARAVAPGGALLRTWPLEGGVSAKMTAFEIALPDGHTQKLIMRQPGERAFRVDPQAAAREYRILQMTQSVGLASPTPYLFDNSGTIFPTPYLVTDYVEGNVELAPADPDNFARQYAAQLASIHRVDRSTVDLSFLADQAAGLTENYWQRVTARARSDEEKRILAVLGSVRSFSPLNAPVLLHGDYWPGNMLWREGRLVAVIDWENAKVGDPLSDLAISRLDTAMVLSIELMNGLTEYYQSLMPTVDFRQLPYWDLWAALRASPDLAEWAASYAPLGRPDVTEASMRAGLRQVVALAFEKLGKQSVPGLEVNSL